MPNIKINGANHSFEGRTVADWLAQHPPQPPFAVSVNKTFVPKQRYGETELCNGDELDIVRPVVGG
ncbi:MULTISPECIES: sulfur carrier protein ThiS [Neisseria]|uniref:Thiamine biosynthesis protein ThiS n=2 Tax=Neisseria TaxID=482 RepID=A0A1X3CP53_9NEIS|nr:MULTISPECIES: sulfur carrier protein ThiS [Neisseria]KPN73043.1 thiamine biosynthesis protein ThiS [Neisseria sp. 74A18]OSI09343.1 thiamine biosynthesis protein ThiS [Neisseria zoodegmatis]OSI15078.1 thiamine biosynthesis protein ThiS [Neisseria dumasiana]OSI16385.1 thiamine biosynthesis protein ThiS [Neisseria dumasiana]SNU78573.1 Thiamine biosynthesis protein ThiS [Neisseria zoodegmatis]